MNYKSLFLIILYVFLESHKNTLSNFKKLQAGDHFNP